MKQVGLATHIWNNHLMSGVLLALFPVLFLSLAWAFFFIMPLAEGAGPITPPRMEEALESGWSGMLATGPFILLGTAVWVAIAFLWHQSIINAATGAKPLTRKEQPELYNLLENLCIQVGMKPPKLYIIESDALNAYASGLSEKSFAVTVTSGLLKALDKQEVETVLAHELTHIRNRDVRLMIIAVVVVGILSFASENLFRTARFRSGRRGDGKGRGVMLLVLFALLLIGRLLAVVIRFAISRRREYLADAGAVELTKNPGVLISALNKISGRAVLPDMPDEMRQMCVENPAGFFGLFHTHPPIEKRIAVLQGMGAVAYAPGRPFLMPDSQGPWGGENDTGLQEPPAIWPR